MRDEKLRHICLWIAGGAATLAGIGIAFPVVQAALFPAFIFVTSVAVLLFLKMLFSRFYRRGVDLANLDMRGSDPWPGKPKGFSDPDWGLFGARTGDPVMLRVRAVLFLGAMPLALAQAWVGIEVVKLWWAGLFVVLELSVMHTAIASHEIHAERLMFTPRLP